MGQYDSSRTRVVPIFTRLYCTDPTGRTWLQPLVELPTHPGRLRATVGSSPLSEALWWPHEKRLSPPDNLLGWLIKNVKVPTVNEAWGGGEVRGKREALVRGDPAVIDEALKRLEKVREERDWAILEGPSQPDVFLETDEVVVVIEGKRTESGPTTTTTWMPVRHQMLRHLDGAWEIKGGRAVYGFFIVEEDSGRPGGILSAWKDFGKATVSPETLAQSLPHRTPEEQGRIAEAFLGVTTWQAVCGRFNIPLAVLIDRVI